MRGPGPDPSRPVGTRAAAHACERLGCAVAVLPAGSLQPGNTIARGRGRWGRYDSRGGLPQDSRALFPSNSFEIARARGDFASLFQRGHPPVVRWARSPTQTMSRRQPQSATHERPIRRGEGAPGIPSVAKNVKPPQQGESLLSPFPTHPVLPPGHTHTPTFRAPHSAAPSCRSVEGKTPARGASVLLRFRRLQSSFLAG